MEGVLSTPAEDHECSSWLCILCTVEDECAELLVDTGATETELVCGPRELSHAHLERDPRPALRTATGAPRKHHGRRSADFWRQGEALRMVCTVVDVQRPVLSVSRLMDYCIETYIRFGKAADGASWKFNRRDGLCITGASRTTAAGSGEGGGSKTCRRRTDTRGRRGVVWP